MAGRYYRQYLEASRAGASAPYDPVAITEGSVTAILRNSTAGAIASVTDILNTNPATQATAGRRPTGAADGSITWDGADVLVWPLVANQNKNTVTLGFAKWFMPVEVVTTQTLVAITNGTGGASLRTFVLFSSGNAIRLDVGNNGLVGRRATASGVLTANVPVFVTGEFNGGLGSEATRHVVTVNCVVQSPSFSALSGGASDVVLNDPTGNILLGGADNADVGANPITVGGRTGRDTIVGTSAMAGVTEGIWTPAARLALMNGAPLV